MYCEASGQSYGLTTAHLGQSYGLITQETTTNASETPYVSYMGCFVI